MKSRDSIIQFIKFAVVGVLNTVVDMIVFYLFVNFVGLNNLISKMISYTCGVVNSYFFNTSWTFKRERKRSKKEFVMFFGVNLISYVVSVLVIYLCTNLIFADLRLANMLMDTFVGGIVSDADKMNSLIGNIFAIPTSVIVNFALNKLFVFKTNRNNS